MGPLAEDLQVLRARMARVETDLEVLQQLGDPMFAGDALLAAPAAGSTTVPLFGSVQEWVAGHFALVYRRPVSPASRWCASWWDHAEAVCRLEALWRTFEAARLEPLRGMADWYRDLDPQLAVLTSPAGPFAQCTPERHSPPRPLPLLPVPPGHWDVTRTDAHERDWHFDSQSTGVHLTGQPQ